MVFTSSIAANWAKLNEKALVPNEEIGKMQVYSNSKLLDAYLFKYLYENDKQNVKYYLVHPGVSGTALFTKAFKSKFFIAIVNGFMKIFANPLWKSALSIVRVLSSEAEEGCFYGPSHFFKSRGYPKKVNFLDKRYKDVDLIVKKSEIVVSYKLIK